MPSADASATVIGGTVNSRARVAGVGDGRSPPAPTRSAPARRARICRIPAHPAAESALSTSWMTRAPARCRDGAQSRGSPRLRRGLCLGRGCAAKGRCSPRFTVRASRAAVITCPAPWGDGNPTAVMVGTASAHAAACSSRDDAPAEVAHAAGHASSTRRARRAGAARATSAFDLAPSLYAARPLAPPRRPNATAWASWPGRRSRSRAARKAEGRRACLCRRQPT